MGQIEWVNAWKRNKYSYITICKYSCCITRFGQITHSNFTTSAQEWNNTREQIEVKMKILLHVLCDCNACICILWLECVCGCVVCAYKMLLFSCLTAGSRYAAYVCVCSARSSNHFRTVWMYPCNGFYQWVLAAIRCNGSIVPVLYMNYEQIVAIFTCGLPLLALIYSISIFQCKIFVWGKLKMDKINRGRDDRTCSSF